MSDGATEIGFKVSSGCHAFRASVITTYLEAGGSLENAHETRVRPSFHDGASEEITLNEVERIGV
jgi:hypothetical protein